MTHLYLWPRHHIQDSDMHFDAFDKSTFDTLNRRLYALRLRKLVLLEKSVANSNACFSPQISHRPHFWMTQLTLHGSLVMKKLLTYVRMLQQSADARLPFKLLQISSRQPLRVYDLGSKLECGRLLHRSLHHRKSSPTKYNWSLMNRLCRNSLWTQALCPQDSCFQMQLTKTRWLRCLNKGYLLPELFFEIVQIKEWRV